MSEVEIQQTRLSRREVLRVGVASASLFVVSGCSLFGGGSELEEARSELVEALKKLEREQPQEVQLLAIARRIGAESRVMVDEHLASLLDLDGLSRNADVSAAELTTFGKSFRAHRNDVLMDLLRLQDELRAELTDEEWPTVVKAINRHANRTKPAMFKEA